MAQVLKVLLCPDAFSGMEFTQITAFDIILAKKDLPAMGGLEMFRVLRSLGLKSKGVIIVDRIENFSFDDLDSELRIEYLLHKPFSAMELCNVILSASVEWRSHCQTEAYERLRIQQEFQQQQQLSLYNAYLPPVRGEQSSTLQSKAPMLAHDTAVNQMMRPVGENILSQASIDRSVQMDVLDIPTFLPKKRASSFCSGANQIECGAGRRKALNSKKSSFRKSSSCTNFASASCQINGNLENSITNNVLGSSSGHGSETVPMKNIPRAHSSSAVDQLEGRLDYASATVYPKIYCLRDVRADKIVVPAVGATRPPNQKRESNTADMSSTKELLVPTVSISSVPIALNVGSCGEEKAVVKRYYHYQSKIPVVSELMTQIQSSHVAADTPFCPTFEDDWLFKLHTIHLSTAFQPHDSTHDNGPLLHK